MLFVRSENLTPNMRLAKPIYNKTGVLLYERDSKITSTIISSISNFGLLPLGIITFSKCEPSNVLPRSDSMEFGNLIVLSL